MDANDAAAKRAGFFLGTSLIDHVKPGMSCYEDEIFGPVLSVVRVETYDEALRLINENPYGNGTAIFTRDGGAARQFQFDVEVGMVGDQRADPGAGGVLQLRRLEGFAVRRSAHVRAGRRAVLHARQGGDQPLARSGHQQSGPGIPASAVRATN